MNITDLATKLGVEQSVATEYIIANGFSIAKETDYGERQVFLIGLYQDYTLAKEEMSEARKGFRYQDGEEMVDKSKQFEAYRQYANDLFKRWQSELEKYNDSKNEFGSKFFVRQRANWLDR